MPVLKMSFACCQGTTRIDSITHRPTMAPISRGSASDSISVSHVWMAKHRTRAARAAHTRFMSMGSSAGLPKESLRSSYSRRPR